MRALILAAGEGRRMQPVTLTTPKPLVEVAGTPMAVRQILALRKAGVEEIVLNVAHLGDRIVETLGDGSAWGVRLRYSVEGRTAGEALETLGGIAKALPMLDDGDGAFIVVAGDIVTDFDYSRLVRAGRALAGSDAVAHLVLAPNPSYHADGDMTLDELGLVRREPRTHTFSSLGVYGTSLFEGVVPVRAKLFPWLWQFCEAGRVTGEVYEGTCGRDILDVKMRVIERCREVGIQVVLSVAVVAGLNDGQLGDLLRFCLDNADVVAGLALQPAFTSGRFDAERALPMSSGDVIFQLAEQSDGLLEPRDVWPLGCSNPLCDTGVFFVKGEPPAGVPAHPSGFYPATRAMTMEEYHAGYSPDSPQGSVFLDILDKKGVEVASGLSVVIMNYMDAVSMDTQRLRECSMMVTVPDGRAIPFCSYHLTDSAGRRVYPPWCKEELR